MNINQNIYGKVSLGLGAVTLLFILSAQFSPEFHDRKPGTISYLVSNIANVFVTSDPAPVTPDLKPLGLLPLTEQNERNLLIGSAIVFSLFSWVLAFKSLTGYEYTLYPAAAMFSVFGGLVSLNGIVAIVFSIITFVGVWYVQSSRIKS
ncbi:MAG: hypothetical protein GY951_02715 [Psychromonas sp.]|nr:hypothetical protein [Psychromonas sp.]